MGIGRVSLPTFPRLGHLALHARLESNVALARETLWGDRQGLIRLTQPRAETFIGVKLGEQSDATTSLGKTCLALQITIGR
jgi:hypothetical protein